MRQDVAFPRDTVVVKHTSGKTLLEILCLHGYVVQASCLYNTGVWTRDKDLISNTQRPVRVDLGSKQYKICLSVILTKQNEILHDIEV